jgi:hypothetical protein
MRYKRHVTLTVSLFVIMLSVVVLCHLLNDQIICLFLAKCIDTYTQQRVEGKTVDPRQEAIVNQVG